MKRMLFLLFSAWAVAGLRPAAAAVPVPETAVGAAVVSSALSASEFEPASEPESAPVFEPEPASASAFTSESGADSADSLAASFDVPPVAVTARPAAVSEQTALPPRGKKPRRDRFLPVRRRMDREIDKIKYVYQGEMITGLTASYGTLSSEDTDFLVILDNINADGTIASVKPYFGYFYRNNRCIGVRFGYTYVDAKLNSAVFDLGEGNDVSFDIPYVGAKSNNYSFGIFHRTYAGLDPKGRFGLFAEVELSMTSGQSEFTFETGGEKKTTYSENIQAKFSFNPGAAVYIFPNVCATLSFGLGGIQYTHVTQKDAEGNKVGSRTASNMRFRLNLAAINIGMTVHLWNKKK